MIDKTDIKTKEAISRETSKKGLRRIYGQQSYG